MKWSNGWVDFKRSFTQEQEDALWQYFIDHAKVQRNGYLFISFYVRDVNDFWRRVHARFTGDFARYDKDEKVQHQEDAINKTMARRIEYVRKKGTLYQKLAVALYRWGRRVIRVIPTDY